MASAVAGTYNQGVGSYPSAGSKGRAPGHWGKAPLKLKMLWQLFAVFLFFNILS